MKSAASLFSNYRHCRKAIYLVIATLMLLAPMTAARAGSIADFTIFAGYSIFGSGTINSQGGTIGSNGDLFLNGVGLQGIRAGGSLFDNFGGLNTTGDVTVNGNVMATFFGNINGNLNVGHNANLTANIGGDIVAGGNVTTSGATTGSIFSHGTTALTGSGTVGGTINQFSAVVPASYTTTALPAAHAFSSGGSNVTLATLASTTLTPGSYGDLVLGGSNTVNLSSGNYYFNAMQMNGAFATLNFDTTLGPVNIFVTGAVFLNHPSVKINGVAFNSIPTTSAGQIYWETHDNFAVQGASLVGTIYAPFGDIDVTNLSAINGRLIAGGDIITDGGAFSVGALSSTLIVPEPPGFLLGLVSLVVLGITSRRRRRPRRFAPPS